MTLNEYMRKDLTAEEVAILDSELRKRRKSIPATYLLFILGVHYAYLNKWGLFVLYFITAGGYFVWGLIDLFRIPSLVGKVNSDIEMQIIRNLTLARRGDESPKIRLKVDVVSKGN